MFLRASPRQSLRGGDRCVDFLLSRRAAATRYVGAGKGERAPLGETELEWGRDGCSIGQKDLDSWWNFNGLFLVAPFGAWAPIQCKVGANGCPPRPVTYKYII